MSIYGQMALYGSAKKIFAFLIVNYPSGSICTCSKDGKILRAEDTSGTQVFTIPENGTWTITSTNGSKTASKNINITSFGSSQSISLLYITPYPSNGIILKKDGTKPSDINSMFTFGMAGFWKLSVNSTTSDYGIADTICFSGNTTRLVFQNCYLATANSLDVTIKVGSVNIGTINFDSSSKDRYINIPESVITGNREVIYMKFPSVTQLNIDSLYSFKEGLF